MLCALNVENMIKLKLITYMPLDKAKKMKLKDILTGNLMPKKIDKTSLEDIENESTEAALDQLHVFLFPLIVIPPQRKRAYKDLRLQLIDIKDIFNPQVHPSITYKQCKDNLPQDNLLVIQVIASYQRYRNHTEDAIFAPIP